MPDFINRRVPLTSCIYSVNTTNSEGKREIIAIFFHRGEKWTLYCQRLTTARDVNRFFDDLLETFEFLPPSWIQQMKSSYSAYFID